MLGIEIRKNGLTIYRKYYKYSEEEIAKMIENDKKRKRE